jgi:hypothetical protein
MMIEPFDVAFHTAGRSVWRATAFAVHRRRGAGRRRPDGSTSTLTNQHNAGKASVIHMLRSLATISPNAAMYVTATSQPAIR